MDNPQEQAFHKYYVKPDYKMDFVEIREPGRLIYFCEMFGLSEKDQEVLSEYFIDNSNILIFDNDNRRILVLDYDGTVISSFFSIN